MALSKTKLASCAFQWPWSSLLQSLVDVSTEGFLSVHEHIHDSACFLCPLMALKFAASLSLVDYLRRLTQAFPSHKVKLGT